MFPRNAAVLKESWKSASESLEDSIFNRYRSDISI